MSILWTDVYALTTSLSNTEQRVRLCENRLCFWMRNHIKYMLLVIPVVSRFQPKFHGVSFGVYPSRMTLWSIHYAETHRLIRSGIIFDVGLLRVTTYLITIIQRQGHILSILRHYDRPYQWPWISLRYHLIILDIVDLIASIESAIMTWSSIDCVLVPYTEILELLYAEKPLFDTTLYQRWNRVSGSRVTGSAIWVRVGSGHGSKLWPGFWPGFLFNANKSHVVFFNRIWLLISSHFLSK